MVEVLWEDANTLVVSKPSGLIVHPDGSTKEATLVDWVLEHYPEMRGVGEQQRLKDGSVVDRPGVVHRLDRDTSGALLLAKTPEAHAFYKSQFQDRSINKTYLAFVHGNFKEKEGVIDRAIGKSRSDFRKWSAERGARGVLREAITEYAVVGEVGGVSLVKAFPKTGRTHQIRVHFKALGRPIICDHLYAPKHLCLLGFDRLALHSHSIEFTTLDGARKIVIAPLPLDFKNALRALSIDEASLV